VFCIGISFYAFPGGVSRQGGGCNTHTPGVFCTEIEVSGGVSRQLGGCTTHFPGVFLVREGILPIFRGCCTPPRGVLSMFAGCFPLTPATLILLFERCFGTCRCQTPRPLTPNAPGTSTNHPASGVFGFGPNMGCADIGKRGVAALWPGAVDPIPGAFHQRYGHQLVPLSRGLTCSARVRTLAGSGVTNSSGKVPFLGVFRYGI
jgi:hypothetical protein